MVNTYVSNHLACTSELNIAGIISLETGLMYSLYLQLTSFTFTTFQKKSPIYNFFHLIFYPLDCEWIFRVDVHANVVISTKIKENWRRKKNNNPRDVLKLSHLCSQLMSIKISEGWGRLWWEIFQGKPRTNESCAAATETWINGSDQVVEPCYICDAHGS